MKEKNLSDLCSSMEILISGLDVFFHFQYKGNFTDSTVQNTGETGDMHLRKWVYVPENSNNWSKMPGHVKRGGTGDPDPDPSPFLVVSASDRQKDLAKVILLIWVDIFYQQMKV